MEILLIQNTYEKEPYTVLKIKLDGTTYWRPSRTARLRQVKLDKELAQAFAISIAACSGMPYSDLIDTLIEERVKSGKIKK